MARKSIQEMAYRARIPAVHAKTPRPADPRAGNPTQEEFEVWCRDAVTRWVAASHAKMAEEAKSAWVKATWYSGKADETELAVLRKASETFLAFIEADWLDHLRNVDPEAHTIALKEIGNG